MNKRNRQVKVELQQPVDDESKDYDKYSDSGEAKVAIVVGEAQFDKLCYGGKYF